jgi:hypothetical protein
VADVETRIRRIRAAVAAVVTMVFLTLAGISAANHHWSSLAVFAPAAAIAAFMTWLRVTRNQPVSFLPAVVIALGGKRSLPPKNHSPKSE